MNETENYWTNRYNTGNTGWDIGSPSSPLITYFDQLEDKNLKILIPGAGNAYEAEYLYKSGFKNIFVLDISETPLKALKKRNPEFPESQLLKEDFFKHQGTYDLVIEQTFFCSFPPLKETRQSYALQMHHLLKSRGKLVGLWFSIPLKDDLNLPPFGGTKFEYINYFEPHFKIKTFETCYNSIPQRQGNELFGIFIKS